MTTASRAKRIDKGPGMDVHFYSEGTLIAGTLGDVPHPVAAAVLITGSGRLNRDSDARLGRRGPVVLRTSVTRQVAEALGTANVATLYLVGDLSHLLRPDPDRKGPVGYRRALRQPVSAEVLALITAWAAGHWPLIIRRSGQ